MKQITKAEKQAERIGILLDEYIKAYNNANLVFMDSIDMAELNIVRGVIRKSAIKAFKKLIGDIII